MNNNKIIDISKKSFNAEPSINQRNREIQESFNPQPIIQARNSLPDEREVKRDAATNRNNISNNKNNY